MAVNDHKELMTIAGRIRRHTVVGAAIASLGIAALTACSSGTPSPEKTVLTTKSAGANYLATTCKANAAADVFSAALSSAETSTSETGPELDNLKAASLALKLAARAAAARLGNPKIVWPSSIRRSIVVLRNQYTAEQTTLSEMATATQMSDEATDYHAFPDSTKAAAASKLIRSTLGLPSTTSSSCSASGSSPAASSVAPATGELLTGTGYTLRAPAGWTTPKDGPAKADTFAIAAKSDAAGAYDTVNVLVGPLPTDTLDVFEKNSALYLEQALGATHVEIRPRVVVAGAARIHLSSLQTHKGITEWDEQYFLTNTGAGVAYTVTFAFDQAESQADREAVAESVLATWLWT